MFRHCLGAALALAATLIASQAAAQATTYTFTSPLYTGASAPPACTVGECTTYTLAQRATITLTFAAPLAPNLAPADLSASVIAYSMDDGVRTTTGPAANAAMLFVNLGTDAGGLPTGYQLVIERTPGPPYLTSTPTDPNSRQSFVYMLPNQTVAESNSVCVSRIGGGAVTGPGVCGSTAQDAGSSIGSVVGPVVVTSAPAGGPIAAVPTMSEWAMILFGAILACSAALYLQRRRLAA